MKNLKFEVHLDRSCTIYEVLSKGNFQYICHCIIQEIAEDIIAMYKYSIPLELKEDCRLDSWRRI